jgi:hypothetical protein
LTTGANGSRWPRLPDGPSRHPTHADRAAALIRGRSARRTLPISWSIRAG